MYKLTQSDIKKYRNDEIKRERLKTLIENGID